jgi:hypothetical protein
MHASYRIGGPVLGCGLISFCLCAGSHAEQLSAAQLQSIMASGVCRADYTKYNSPSYKDCQPACKGNSSWQSCMNACHSQQMQDAKIVNEWNTWVARCLGNAKPAERLPPSTDKPPTSAANKPATPPSGTPNAGATATRPTDPTAPPVTKPQTPLERALEAQQNKARDADKVNAEYKKQAEQFSKTAENEMKELQEAVLQNQAQIRQQQMAADELRAIAGLPCTQWAGGRLCTDARLGRYDYHCVEVGGVWTLITSTAAASTSSQRQLALGPHCRVTNSNYRRVQ